MRFLFFLPLFLGLVNGDDHASTATSTHHPDTVHTSTTLTSPIGYSFSNGMMTTARSSSTGVVCRPLGSTDSRSLTAFCPILSAHHTHTGMMGGSGMMGSEYECPNYDGSNFHYTMNMMGSDPMCCTYSATLTRVGSSVGCCPCGSICTGTVPGTQNWYTAAGQVVLTTGSVPGTVTVTATPVGSGGSSLHGSAACLNLPLVVGSLVLAVLMGNELFF